MANADNSTKPDCAAETIGREIAKIIEIEHALDVETPVDGFGKRIVEKRNATQFWQARRDALQETVTTVRAETLTGALFQTIMTFDRVRDLWDNCIDERSTQAKDFYEGIERLLFSVASVLRRESGASATDLGAEFYMSSDLDPFAAADAAKSKEIVWWPRDMAGNPIGKEAGHGE